LQAVRRQNACSSWLRRVAVTGALLGSSLLVTFCVLEVSLRILYPPPARFLYPQESYDFDPEVGYVLRPTQTAFTHDRPVHTNALGLRDHEIAPDPAPGTVRVLALGDSQTFGNGLDLDETWPKQLERTLPTGPARRWEVVNAGVPATDTWQHEILLRRLLDVTKPHIVVLALYVNDVVPRHDPRVVDTTERTNSWEKRLTYTLKRSAVVTWLFHRVYLPWYARRADQVGSVEEHVLAGRSDPRAERGWQQVEQSLMVMKQRCDGRGITLIVAVLPRRDQVSGGRPERSYNQRAVAVATAHGIEVIDLLPDLIAAYRVHGAGLFVPWDGHNSAAANRVIAATLAPRLADVAARRVGHPLAVSPAG
jgi:lysophospholipase L1-like esterase